MTKPKFKIVIKYNLSYLPVNGGAKKEILKNGSILLGKKYSAQIFKRKQHTKNHIDWIRNVLSVKPRCQDPDDSYTWSFIYFWIFCQWLQMFTQDTWNLKEKVKTNIFLFWFMTLKRSLFDHLMPKSCGKSLSKKWF